MHWVFDFAFNRLRLPRVLDPLPSPRLRKNDPSFPRLPFWGIVMTDVPPHHYAKGTRKVFGSQVLDAIIGTRQRDPLRTFRRQGWMFLVVWECEKYTRVPTHCNRPT